MTNDEDASAEQCFVEIAHNIGGEVCAWLYHYPRPHDLDDDDIGIALEPGTTVLPPDRRDWDTADDCYYAPYFCSAIF